MGDKTNDGREKSLLRSVAGHLLLAINRDRVKSPYPVTQDPAYYEAIHSEFTEMMNDPSEPIHQLVDAAGARRMTGSRVLGFALQFNGWLRRYEPELRI